MKSLSIQHSQETALEEICGHLIKNLDATPCPTIFEMVFEKKKRDGGEYHVAVYESVTAHELMMNCMNSDEYETAGFKWIMPELAEICIKQIEEKFVLGIFIAGYEYLHNEITGLRDLTLLIQGRTANYHNNARLGAESYFSQEGGKRRLRLKGDYKISETSEYKPSLKFTECLDTFFAFYHLSAAETKTELIEKIKERTK